MEKNDHIYYSFKEKYSEMICSNYEPPSLPFPILHKEDVQNIPPFGKEFKKKHFLLNPEVIFIQHGSYGATFRLAMNIQRNFQDLAESQPCKFMNSHVLHYMVYAIRELSFLVGSNPEDTVFVSNATVGFNTVIRSMKFSEGDTIIVTSLGYDAVTNAIKYVCSQTGAQLVIVQIPFPLKKEEISKKIIEALSSTTRLVVVDHITSGTAIIMPIEEIIKECRIRKIPLFIDGAHSVGQIPLNLNELNPDFYVSNCHKWLCAPKGVAFLRVSKNFQSIIHPLSISHGYDKGFSSEFLWTGTVDFSSYLSILAVVAFYKIIDSSKTMEYNHKLVIWAGKMLSEMWGTNMLISDETMIGSMLNVKLPYNSIPSAQETKQLHDVLVNTYNIQTVLIPINNSLYARLSAQIYNDQQDYITFGKAIKEILMEK
jgi:isopenicillin-N epimerase